MKIVRSDRTLCSEKFEGEKIEMVYRYDYITGKSGIYTIIGGV